MDTNSLENLNHHELSQIEAFRSAASKFMTKVYGWMSFALIITALAAHAVARSEYALSLIFGNSLVFWGLIIAEFALVFILSSRINKMSAGVASLMFVLFSLINGLTLASIFLTYSESSIVSTFLITAGTFTALSIYGYATKKDLSSFGNILFFALIGLVIATIVNIFFSSSTLQWIINYAGVLVFSGLVIYDTNKLKQLAYAVSLEGNNETASSYAIHGALSLYLDFINLFIYLLRILGNRD